MYIIKKFKQFNESISGCELVGQHIGPNYPEQVLQNTLDQSDTEILMSKYGDLYTYSNFQNLYFDYLKLGGKYHSEFNKLNLDIIIDFLNK